MKEIIEEDYIRELFGGNLRRLRGLQNLSQMGLADRADLTPNFINDIEKGKKWVSVETLTKLSSALQVEPYQFFLPESVSRENGDGVFGVYLNDFSDSLEKMVGELKTRYARKLGGDQEERTW